MSFLLGLVLIWCEFTALPPLVLLYWLWSEKFGGSLGLVNACKYQEPFVCRCLGCTLHFIIAYFNREYQSNQIMKEQISAAHNVLSAPPAPFPAAGSALAVREFNFDIATLLQFVSTVYERKSQAIYETINRSPSTLGTPSFFFFPCARSPVRIHSRSLFLVMISARWRR